ncbi:MAG: ATP-binding protein [Acidimicrobiia bacterium]|nr:ATP-binding protein [Acidimicrobiia bacterium]
MRRGYRVSHDSRGIGTVIQTDPIIEYRIRVLSTGLIVSWFGLLLAAIGAATAEDVNWSVTGTALGVMFVTLVIVTFAPWRTMMRSGVADWFLVIWSVITIIMVLLFELSRDDRPSGMGFLIVTFFAAATLLRTSALVGVGFVATLAYGYALFESTELEYTSIESASPVLSFLAFVATIVFILLVTIGIRTQLARTSEAYQALVAREAELAQHEREISQLYDVSRTIGAGTKLDEVLPELIGRVAQSVHARVGLVLLYDPETEHLDLMSPIWAAGHTVQADPFSLSLDESSIGPQVFMGGDATVINDLAEAGDDRLIKELEADRLAAVAMRVENRTIGVLIVGDKTSEFTQEDIATLESVAAPAALVLNQMARYELARSTSERMAELAELKTDFVSVVSHELRTPLTSIIGALTTLQRPELMPTDPRAEQLVDMAAKQSTRLKTLIEDLLVMSRIEAESLPVRPEKIDLEPFIAELLEALPGGDVVEHEPTAGVGTVLADPDHLARVLTNLVDNAIKYGGESDITLITAPGNGEVQVSVIDHGPGIPYEQHDRMFDRFTQLQPHATRSKGGAGLGLSIVRGLVEAMGGRVWYEPTVGGGATFTFTIPTAD